MSKFITLTFICFGESDRRIAINAEQILFFGEEFTEEQLRGKQQTTRVKVGDQSFSVSETIDEVLDMLKN